MIGVARIGTHVAEDRVDNLQNAVRHGSTESFVTGKIGFLRLAKKKNEEKASDLCMRAWAELGLTEEQKRKIDFLCVCTQNGDFSIPHTSAILHAKIGLPDRCAAFDISLGCSGYPYSLSVAKAFMETNGLHYGVLFTCDPYSEIVDENDRDTALLFGDAATVTVLSEEPVFQIGKGAFSTAGSFYEHLMKRRDAPLHMNGRGIYNFVMRYVPDSIASCLEANGLTAGDVDVYLLHQASKFVLDSLIGRYGFDAGKLPFLAADYGNTVSSSIPIMLKDHLATSCETLVLSGFGVGLSIGTIVLRRVRR